MTRLGLVRSEPMTVTIRKATERHFWYADCIGKTFDVCEIRNDHQKGQYTVNDGEYNQIILKRDCW